MNQTENTTQLKKVKNSGGFGEFISIVIQALIIAVLFQTVLFQPFTIPSGSMRPTLLVGDYLFVSKYAYGYSRYSIPFSPDLFSGRIFGSEPKRGDIVVFRPPNRIDDYYIKRLVGLPGDRIQVREGTLYINDQAVPRELVGQITNVDVTEVTRPVDVYRETMPNGVTYNTLDMEFYPALDDTKVFEVPQGYYFMMGDNRDRSDDSRMNVGYVPYENLVGRANLIFFSIGNGASAWKIWRWPLDIRWDRLFSSVNTIKYFPPDK